MSDIPAIQRAAQRITNRLAYAVTKCGNPPPAEQERKEAKQTIALIIAEETHYAEMVGFLNKVRRSHVGVSPSSVLFRLHKDATDLLAKIEGDKK